MKQITVPALARVEGEGGLYIGMSDGKPVEIRLDIYEPPRFFEAFLVGRHLQEVPDITARICGICPVAYQMSSITAMEYALNIEISSQIYALRRLFYCGEYIESHALHIFFLQAPDLLGFPSALDMAGKNPELLKNALRMKKIGNEILKRIGGRSVHPVSACVGGWHRWPDKDLLDQLLSELEWALDTAISWVNWANGLTYPSLEVDYEFVAITHPEEYGLMRGEIITSKGSRIRVDEFEKAFLEEHVRHSNALHGRKVNGDHYLVGPLARLNMNHDQLMPAAKTALQQAKVKLPIKNPYMALLARTIELVHFIEEAIKKISAFQPFGEPTIKYNIKAGEGFGMSEAPRGLLYHRYKIDDAGRVLSSRIVPPTAQNLPRIEADLFALAPALIKMKPEAAKLTAEHLIRSYDPCISCATHFLDLRIEEVES
jgi:sulfhydrogenase subunit alpha